MVEREGAREVPGADAPDREDAEAGGAGSLVEMVLSEHAERASQGAGQPAPRLSGVVIGVLAGLGEAGDRREPLVDFPQNPRGEPLLARSTVTVGEADLGREAALMFEDGDPARPILLGLLHRSEPEAEPLPELQPAGVAAPAAESRPIEVEADGEKVVVSAARELVLRCGNASITLTSAGKILIRGAYVLTRSSGVNRIQGGSVQIN